MYEKVLLAMAAMPGAATPTPIAGFVGNDALCQKLRQGDRLGQILRSPQVRQYVDRSDLLEPFD